MKKKEQPKQKEKEFSVSPFKTLKGVALGAGDQQPAAPGKESKGKAPAASVKPGAPKAKGAPAQTVQSAQSAEPAQSRQDLEDDWLFLDAMADVRRVGKGAAVAPARVKAQTEASTSSTPYTTVWRETV